MAADDQSVPQVPNSFRGTDMYEPSVDQLLLGRECLQYAIRRFDARRKSQIKNMNKLYASYNGITSQKNLKWLNETYGKANAVKFVDWRFGKVKLDLLLGEFIRRPINATCYTINRASLIQKLDDYHAQLGLKYTKDKVDKIYNTTGVRPFEGMQVLDGTDEEIWKQINSKTKNEMLMQIILKKIMQVEDIKTKLADNFADTTKVAEAFSKTYIDNHGITRHRTIDPRDALFEEAERDPFLLQSPYLGERRLMFEHDIYANWDLNSKRKELVKNMFTSGENSSVNGDASKSRQYIYNLSGMKAIETFTIEWYAVKPLYTLINKRSSGIKKNVVSHEWIQDNDKKLRTDIKSGRTSLDVRYKLVLWEDTQIGENVFLGAQEVPNIIGNLENPYYTTSNYSGFLFNTSDGVRVSLQESLENLSELYNVVMWQIRREVNKAKGKIIPYDRATLPKKMTMKQVLHKMVNEGIYDYDSSADGNASQREARVNSMLKDIDLGVSESIGKLIEIKREIEATADRLTGINNDRQGDIAASSTATNANSAIQISRTITEYMFYMFGKYCENVLKKVMEHGKLSFGVLNPDLGRMLLGDEAIRFLDSIQNLPNDSFGLGLSDSSKEDAVRTKIEQQWLPSAINAQELRSVDAWQAAMAESVDEMTVIAEKGWKIVKDQMQQQQESAQQAKSMDQQQKLIAAKEADLAQKRHEIDRDIIQGLIKAGLLTQEAANQYINDMKMAQMSQQEVDAEQKNLQKTG
jgi:hypothetical protein